MVLFYLNFLTDAAQITALLYYQKGLNTGQINVPPCTNNLGYIPCLGFVGWPEIQDGPKIQAIVPNPVHIVLKMILAQEDESNCQI